MKTSAPLSKVQYGLYVECVAHQGEACYNLPYLYVLDGTLEEERLRKAIETAVAAHPTLFTRIELDEQGDPLQTIDDTETFTLSTEEGTMDVRRERLMGGRSSSRSTSTKTVCSTSGCSRTANTSTSSSISTISLVTAQR